MALALTDDDLALIETEARDDAAQGRDIRASRLLQLVQEVRRLRGDNLPEPPPCPCGCY